MSGNETNSMATTPGNTTKRGIDEWNHLFIPFEIINLTLLVVTIWVFMSLIVFGTKTNRWRKKAGDSALNSGMIYIACTIAVGLLLPTLLATEVLFHLAGIENGLDWCEFVCDAGNLSFYANLSAAYMFLWLRLRLIYSHPYVKERIWKHAKYLIMFVFVVILLVSLGLMGFYVIPGSYQAESYGCTHRPKTEDNFWEGTRKNILLSVLLFFAQSLMMFLAVYPAVKVKFKRQNEFESESDKILSGSTSYLRTKIGIRPRGGVRIKSPIELAVKRTLISCAVMVASDILAVLPVIFVFPGHAPAQLRRTMYNVGSFVNIFCMVATFGFAFRVLTLFCTTLPNLCKRHRPKSSAGKCTTSPRIGLQPQ